MRLTRSTSQLPRPSQCPSLVPRRIQPSSATAITPHLGSIGWFAREGPREKAERNFAAFGRHEGCTAGPHEHQVNHAPAVASLLIAAGLGTAHAQEPTRSSLDADERFGIVPVGAVLYAPETGVTFAAAALLYTRLGPAGRVRDSKVMLAAAYTLQSQWLVQLSGTLFAFEDAAALDYEVDVSYFPKKFYGIGNDTSIRDDEEAYIRQAYQLELRPAARVLPNLYVGPAFQIKQYDVNEIDPNRQLASGRILGAEGGTDVAFGVAGFYDTREPTLNPLAGMFVDAQFSHSGPTWGSSFQHQGYIVDVRGYVPIAPCWQHVLAWQAYGEFHSGEPPFWMLSELGGPSRMRGHYQGRYRDRQMVELQAEYRLPVVWRLGAVGFAGVGEVARDLKDFRPADSKFSLGGGLRLMLDRDARINVRIDVGWGGDDWGPYVALGEAF